MSHPLALPAGRSSSHCDTGLGTLAGSKRDGTAAAERGSASARTRQPQHRGRLRVVFINTGLSSWRRFSKL